MKEYTHILRLITQITAGYYRLIEFVIILMLSWDCLLHKNNKRIDAENNDDVLSFISFSIIVKSQRFFVFL